MDQFEPRSVGNPRDKMSMQEAALEWLTTKTNRTGSQKTYKGYRVTLSQFDAFLREQGASLDGEPRYIGRLAQAWAYQSVNKEHPSSGTINTRLSILSSFYIYAFKHGACEDNPIRFVERPPNVIEHAAPYLDIEYVNARLQQIDTDTLEGKRDKAMISLALTTGRRASELTGLRWGDITIMGTKITAKWRCKGGKILTDTLKTRTVQVLFEYLQSWYGPDLENITPESPIFISTSNNNRGGTLSHQSVANIYKARLGVTQVHASRHTFSVSMEEAGASITEIGDRLGHSNYNTTSTYLKRLRNSENKFGDRLEDMFGI